MLRRTVVETSRLILRMPEAADVQPLWEIHLNPEVIRYLRSGVPRGVEVAWRNVALMIGHWHMLGYGPWIVTAKGTGEVLGRVGLWNEPGGSGLELGWTVRRSAWGRGIATEAAMAALAWGWTHLQHDEVLCVIHATNVPSVRIAEKLGARQKHHHGEGDAKVLTYSIARPSVPTSP